ncbi:MAG: RsmE family RNA methyltransferase [gamma proteobacterium symbiont of Bathyaustriella thionipta]|nr:RsmE family RNA methyltransferase [gamma proteobacterium symbiont of Bathyaustriella thionipta]MCU7950156.1 RsmE family RNA methyltransferase [gamma proteobacterium symbiont of Bathyaustriella thionipta]MCU7953768.1 RsmE family RNA methyltransferase [gamma proteobacterium symbiont of Bathyaustriella thionipta]MCU7958241.1 RsmE family RNA methyltransferase [gamma proteobacterium symbiont of Bathyaustriella thionipta]MCU7967481.1 RsmE family RNA methyltransferase [gamma proteobacterium symbion
MILGLEQAKDTIMPEVMCYQRFKPFVEDVLPHLIQDSRAIIAHPGQGSFCTGDSQYKSTLAVGPEGGFIDYEVEKFKQAGFSSCHLGERILRVENAIPVLLGRFI